MRLWTLLGSITVLLMIAAAAAGSAPATQSSQTDRFTQDLLNDVESGAAVARDTVGQRQTPSSPAPVSGSGFVDRVSAYLHWRVLWPTLVTAAALAIAGGVVGVFMVLRREALVALSVPPVVMLGAALGLRLEWPTLPPALGTVAMALVLIAWSTRRGRGASLLPALYIAGVCLSILVIANAGAHLMDLQKMFTGIDVAVGENQAVRVSAILLIVGFVCAILWRRWLLLAQAPAAAELARLHPVRWNVLFLCLLATILVLATDALGTVIVIALLFLPAAAVLPWTRRIPQAMLASVFIAFIAVAGGFVVSNEMRWPFSQSVGGVGFAIFLVSHLLALVIA